MRQRIANFVINFSERSTVYKICGLEYIRPAPKFLTLKEARDCRAQLVNVRCEIIDLSAVRGKNELTNIEFQVRN